jgi:hypothetical protein
VWESVRRNMTTIVDWLKMVFGPLLEVATIAYKARCVKSAPRMSESCNNSFLCSVTQTRKVRAERLATTEDKRETKRKASGMSICRTSTSETDHGPSSGSVSR